MDSFVIIKKEKKKNLLSLHEHEIKKLKQYLNEDKNVFLCGKSGFGKTFILNEVLNESNSIEIWDETLRKKDIFMDTIKKSNMYSYIEDYESDIHVYKSIIETICNGNKLTNKPIVVTSKNVYFKHLMGVFKKNLIFYQRRRVLKQYSNTISRINLCDSPL